MLDNVPRFRAKRLFNGEYVEGCLIMREFGCFVYILTDDNFNHMITDMHGNCNCKLIRVLEYSVEQIR